MWGKKNHIPKIDTLVGKKTSIIGDIEFNGGLHIDGMVEGDIKSLEEQATTLIISDSGVIHGNIDVPNVIINGQVNGDVHAYGRLELAANAIVNGSVYYNVIEIASGAEINGNMVKDQNQQNENERQSALQGATKKKSKKNEDENSGQNTGHLDKMVSDLLPG